MVFRGACYWLHAAFSIGYRQQRPSLAKPLRLATLAVNLKTRPERVVPNAKREEVIKPMRGDNPYGLVIVKVNADTGCELRPRRHAFFERAKGRHHLPKMVGKPVMHRGLVGDFPLQRGHERAKAQLEVDILLWAVSRAIEVDDIHIFKH